MQDLIHLIAKPENLVFVAGAIQTAALLLQEQVRIRLVLLIGSMAYLFYYSLVASDPLWEAIWVTLAMSLANLIGLGRLLAARSRRLIPDNLVSLYAMFGGIQPGEFRSIMRMGEIITVENTTSLTEVGVVPDHLFFIIDGSVKVEQGQGTFLLPARHFVGEVSLMLGTPASATVSAAPGVHLVVWPRKTLGRAMTEQQDIKLAMESLLSKDMARKVASSASRIDNRYAHQDPSMEAMFV